MCRLRVECDWSEVDILKLAAGVESNTIHPIGKAIVAAARAVNAPTVKVVCWLQAVLFFVEVVYELDIFGMCHCYSSSLISSWN